MISGGYSLEPTKRFLDKINENPSETSRSELYDFLKVNSLPITEDGTSWRTKEFAWTILTSILKQ
jgi:hypothetical protein